MNDKKRGKNLIFIVGFMASGKTTVGKLLAKKLGMSFYDTDSIIEKETGKTIPEIFKTNGEEAFRDIERELLKNIAGNGLISSGVIATGGGMPCFADNMELIKDLGITVYLKAPINDIINRIDNAEKRPVFKREMEKGELFENIKRLLELREPYYQKADIIINSVPDRTILEIVDELINRLRKIKHGNY